MKQIKSQKEANTVNSYLVKQTVESFSVDSFEAQKRIDGLIKSGILENGNPDDPATRLQIDVFLSIPSENYHHLMDNK